MALRSVLTPDSRYWPFEDAQSAHDVKLLYTAPPHEARQAGEDEFEYVDGALTLSGSTLHRVCPQMRTMSNPTGPRERRMFATHCLSALGCMAQNLQDCIVYEGDGNFQTKRSVVQ
jgi:hypothetical protein